MHQPRSCLFNGAGPDYSGASHTSAYEFLFELVGRQPIGCTFEVNAKDVGLSVNGFRDFALVLSAANGSTGMNVLGITSGRPSTTPQSVKLMCKRVAVIGPP